ncbi:hypothetical protein NMG60_11006819, partial [Bertholletia excelsa]
MLKKVSMQDMTVILTILNKEWARPGSVLDIFLESFRLGEGTSHLLNHLLIFTVDGQGFRYCRSVHLHCFNLENYRFNFSAWNTFQGQQSHKLGWRKIELLAEIIKLGYSVVFTDADVTWLRNPLPHILSSVEIATACELHAEDGQGQEGKRADGGFFFMKSNDRSVEFLNYWRVVRVVYPNFSPQSAFEMIRAEGMADQIGMRIKYLPTNHFGSFCNWGKDLSQVVIAHAKCYQGITKKVEHLRHMLNVWENHKAASSTQK